MRVNNKIDMFFFFTFLGLHFKVYRKKKRKKVILSALIKFSIDVKLNFGHKHVLYLFFFFCLITISGRRGKVIKIISGT